MTPENPHAGEPIGTVEALYDATLPPDLMVNTARNLERLFPTRRVARGPRVHPLPRHEVALPAVTFRSNGRQRDTADYLALNRVTGLLVLKDGAIALETYRYGNTERTRWMSMSMAKSVTATLVGAAIREGRIGGVDDLLTQYLPTLAGSAYEGVTVGDVLQMTSGAAWTETYTDPASDRRRMLTAQRAQRPGAILELMAALPRAARPGTRHCYNTGETHLLGAVLRAALDQPLAGYLSERIWARFGMEADATWWLEAPGGLEVAGSGLSATLRDYGRFGLFLAGGGRAGDTDILPDGWLAEAGRSRVIGGERIDYGYQLWPVPEGEGDIHAGAYEARGIFGQHLYVNPQRRLVIAVWGATDRPVPEDPVAHYDFFAAVCAALG